MIGPEIELFPISQSNGYREVSEPDLCAQCEHHVAPHERPPYSRCAQGWPGLEDSNGYVVHCVAYEEVGDE